MSALDIAEPPAGRTLPDEDARLANDSEEVDLAWDMKGIFAHTLCMNLLATLEGDMLDDVLPSRMTVCLISFTLSTISPALGRDLGSPAQPSETNFDTSAPTFRSTCDGAWHQQ